MTFNDRAHLAKGFTSSIEDIQELMMLSAPHGNTALLDAIHLGLIQMRGAHNSTRALLIISDGGDNNSRDSEADVERLVKESDTQIYAIGIFNRTDLYGASLLPEITDPTGGRLFAIDKLNELPAIAAKIGMELRNQYILGYQPSDKARDGRWRKIKIKLRTPTGFLPLNIHSKLGYYAPRQ